MLLFFIETGLFILYMIYLETSPKLGNIWWRITDNGGYTFCFNGLLSMLIFPFKNIFVWHYKFWDINFIIWLLFGYGIYILIKSN